MRLWGKAALHMQSLSFVDRRWPVGEHAGEHEGEWGVGVGVQGRGERKAGRQCAFAAD